MKTRVYAARDAWEVPGANRGNQVDACEGAQGEDAPQPGVSGFTGEEGLNSPRSSAERISSKVAPPSSWALTHAACSGAWGGQRVCFPRFPRKITWGLGSTPRLTHRLIVLG